MRVARPTMISSSPVANGSSVPAWPVLTPPSARRTEATTSCEVTPAGLSISSTPSTEASSRNLPLAASSTRRWRPPVAAVRRWARVGGALCGRRGGVQLRGDLAAQELHQLLGSVGGGEARGAAMAAASAGARDRRDVHVVVGGAQRHLVLAVAFGVAQLAHERRDLGALHRPQVIDDSLRVALLGAGPPEVLGADRREGQLAAVEAAHL